MGEQFEKIKAWVEKHPLATAGIVFVIGLILVYYFFSGSSSGAANNSSEYGAAAAVNQANDQLAAAQLAAQASSNQAGLAAGVQSQAISAQQAIQTGQTTAGEAVAEQQIAANQVVALAQIKGNTTLAQIQQEISSQQGETAVSLAGIQANENIVQSQNYAKVISQLTDNQYKLAALNAGTQLSLANYAYQENSDTLGHVQQIIQQIKA